MIEFSGVFKRYGQVLALDGLGVRIEPGRVTGLLGPNGAGKSTGMRILLGLDHPTSGQALIGGRRYGELSDPLRRVGALLDARGVHPGRSARNHLLGLARANGIAASRVEEVLDQVGIARIARRRAGTLSLGMGQRLGIAAALLGDPDVLILDEPLNGLDTDGVRWVRSLLRGLAAQGRTVLVSSHLLAEMHQTADHVVVIGRGRLLADCSTAKLVGDAADPVVVRSPNPGAAEVLRTRLPSAHITVGADGDPDALQVAGADEGAVGAAAHAGGLVLHHLARRTGTLEAGYLRLVDDEIEFAAERSEGAGHVAHAAQ
ncbi:MAG: ATP-binding cassette domain-containing protein [Pseudonocardia sp.]|nr:ATP-binding cassette domain-containing protein [Actinomycetes bacterium]MDN5918051.1 ATP-binding cassette domain-containing protein [Pseudonocardia sp.]